jgi:hypothetical protein
MSLYESRYNGEINQSVFDLSSVLFILFMCVSVFKRMLMVIFILFYMFSELILFSWINVFEKVERNLILVFIIFYFASQMIFIFIFFLYKRLCSSGYDGFIFFHFNLILAVFYLVFFLVCECV